MYLQDPLMMKIHKIRQDKFGSYSKHVNDIRIDHSMNQYSIIVYSTFYSIVLFSQYVFQALSSHQYIY